MIERTINSICSSPSLVPPDNIPPALPPVPPDPIVATLSHDDDVVDVDVDVATPPVPAPIVETVSDDDDDAGTDDDVHIDPPPTVLPLADHVEYMSLNTIDFSDTSFAWSNPSPSSDVQHLPDSDPKLGPYDSIVEATLHQLNITTKLPDDEPVRIAVPIHQVTGKLPSKALPTKVDYSAPRGQIDTGVIVSCTDKLHILHKYRAYDKFFVCPLKLSGAVSSSEDVLPLGEGFLHAPAINQQDFVAVQCFYSPHIASTLISKNDIKKTAAF